MKCPGQDTRYWHSDAIFETRCPKCGNTVEFFRDDSSRKCGRCGHRFGNPQMDFGCAAYCPYAEQCLGGLPEGLASAAGSLKDRVALEMKRHYGNDFARIGHSARLAEYAEKIGKNEGVNLAVTLSAAYLLHVGRAAAEILSKAGADEELTGDVLALIERYHAPDENNDPAVRVLKDAGYLADMEKRLKKGDVDRSECRREMDRVLLTRRAREIAGEFFA